MPTRPPRLRLMAWQIAGFACAYHTATAADLSRVAPEIVALPEFKVFADRVLPPQENWQYARIGNFEVLSSASRTNTRRFVNDFLAFQNVLQIIAPAARLRSELPAALVLCEEPGQYQRLTRTVASVDRVSSARGSALLTDQELSFMIVNFAPFPGSFDSDAYEYAPNDAFYRAYVRSVLKRLSAPPPDWFVEGLSSLVGYVKFTSNSIEYANLSDFMTPGPRGFNFDRSEVENLRDAGRRGIHDTGATASPDPSATEERLSRGENVGLAFGAQIMGGSSGYDGTGSGGWIADDNRSLGTARSGVGTITFTQIPLIPLQDFFAGDGPSVRRSLIEKKRFDLAASWNKQAFAFVHLGLYGEKKKYQKGFIQFVTRSTSEPVTEELFRECFGLGFAEMFKVLERYITFAKYNQFAYDAGKGQSFTRVPPLEVRPATDAEVGRIKGEAYRLGGASDQATHEFVSSYLRGERDPALLASLGLMARQRGDDRRARIYLEKIADARIPRPRAYLELGRLRREYFERGLKPEDTFSGREVAAILGPLQTANTFRPLLPETFIEIARVWERSAVAPTREQLAVLLAGLRQFPRNAELTGRTAELHAKHGFSEEASRLAARLRPPPRVVPTSSLPK